MFSKINFVEYLLYYLDAWAACSHIPDLLHEQELFLKLQAAEQQGPFCFFEYETTVEVEENHRNSGQYI